MIRSSKHYELKGYRLLAVVGELATVGLVFWDCAKDAQPPLMATEPRPSTRAPGVSVDPGFAFPEPAERAPSSAGLVALRPPLPERAVRDRVDDFFRAVLHEDLERLVQLVTADATVSGRARGPSPALLDQWRARFRAFNYEALASQRVYRSTDMAIWPYEDLASPGPGTPPRPTEMQPGDQLVRVPLMVVRTGGDRVFGDELVLVLRRVEDGYRIRSITEDFQPP